MGDKLNPRRCDRCGYVFESEWSDDDANAEALALFGVPDSSTNPGMACICDECFEGFDHSA